MVPLSRRCPHGFDQYKCFTCVEASSIGHRKSEMKKYAVAIIELFDHVMKVEVVEANDIFEAQAKHSMATWKDFKDHGEPPQNLEDLKTLYFNADSMIDILELK